eukprot:4343021-Amphidinium_carterae.2
MLKALGMEEYMKYTHHLSHYKLNSMRLLVNACSTAREHARLPRTAMPGDLDFNLGLSAPAPLWSRQPGMMFLDAPLTMANYGNIFALQNKTWSAMRTTTTAPLPLRS